MPAIPIDFAYFLSNHPFHYEIYSKVSGKVACARQPYVRVAMQIAVSLVGSNAVIGSYFGRSRFQWQRIGGDSRSVS